jgi:SAUR family protein
MAKDQKRKDRRTLKNIVFGWFYQGGKFGTVSETNHSNNLRRLEVTSVLRRLSHTPIGRHRQSHLQALLYILNLTSSSSPLLASKLTRTQHQAICTARTAAAPEMEEQQGGRASNKIMDIVRLQQLLKKWKKLATVASSSSGKSSVPRGSFAVYVGDEMRRFVIPTEYLDHWAFAELLREAEEEFGFRHEGALRIPCDVEVFEGILRVMQG